MGTSLEAGKGWLKGQKVVGKRVYGIRPVRRSEEVRLGSEGAESTRE